MKKLLLVVLFLGLVSCGEDEPAEGVDSQGVVDAGNTSAGQSKGVHDWFRASVEFVRIPKGVFMMGSPATEPDRDEDENGADGKQVQVEISRPFEMMAHEVTQELYERVMKENPSYFKRQGDCDNWDSFKKRCPDNPVDSVTFNEAQEFIRKLNGSLGLEGCEGRPQDSTGCYRLPTEAEWEWAVRAGSKTAYFYGDDPSPSVLGRYAIFSVNSGGRTHRVKGNRLPNPHGLYDVYGNVWEWCQDIYDDELPGGKDPLVTSSGWFSRSRGVLRGGSWNYGARVLRSAFRISGYPGMGASMSGSAS